MNENHSPQSPDQDTADKTEVIKEENIGETRHDEPVTAKGVLRSMFMANEPEQRMEVIDSENQTDPKSDA